MTADIYRELADIVGEEWVSNHAEELNYYNRDAGLMEPHKPDFVVLPDTVQQIQKIMEFANAHRVPVVPVGAGLALTGLVIPLKGGIAMDMKRLDRILEVNANARYVIVEGGVTQGKLKAYLEDNFPDLRHSLPEAPPISTLAANVALHGQGRLSQQYGFNSDMVSGMEVVLPNGKICKIGSPAISPFWFTKGPPLPDLSGLFLGWLGTTGVITKLAMRLFPNKKLKDLETFVTDREELIPDLVYRLTHTEMTEDIAIWSQPKPLMFAGNYHMNIFFTGDTEEELEFKRKMICRSLQDYVDSRDGGFMMLSDEQRTAFLQNPQKAMTTFADVRKGGGFEYSGPIIPMELYPVLAKKVRELGDKYGVIQNTTGRIISQGHCMMFAFSFTFNRADNEEMERVKSALYEAAAFSLENGACLWKPTIYEQKMMISKMDPTTREMIRGIKGLLDPNGIMNPGNWEIE